MAFRPPQRIQTSRQISHPGPSLASEEPQSATSSHRKRSLEDSQEEWVLFSPPAPSLGQTDTTSTERTPRTAGLSRLSDFGSLDTAAPRSELTGEYVSELITEHASDLDEDNDAELDSLDDGLHAFHEPSEAGSPRAKMIKSGETVLPTHDGLGTFGESSLVQDHLRQFERFAPKRKQRRRSSVQRTLDALHEVEEVNDEEAKITRIEKWRLEQSKALLEEIERETRRMRRANRPAHSDPQARSELGLTASEMTSPREPGTGIDQTQQPPTEGPPENEGFWRRFTRRVIRDLIGIDEDLLSVLLGESLPSETQELLNNTPA